MGMYKYIREAWKTPKKTLLKDSFKETLIQWRKQPATVKVERPTRLDKARSLGYRAKQGILVVRQRLLRGGRQNPKGIKGRRSKRMSRRKDLNLSYQTIAETRVADKYLNCEVLNSYYVGQDGKHYWYEVILVDKNHPAIRNDKTLSWITSTKHTNRVYRGLSAAAKKSRGLQNKGKGAEKIRPTQKANKNRMK
ncbi:50S ribosomal protein L15e [Candidatus Woesearchaeota archaeon]|nr:50S ribosomal protein L15e [Candidatus Woesearchaeota archaeon]